MINPFSIKVTGYYILRNDLRVCYLLRLQREVAVSTKVNAAV